MQCVAGGSSVWNIAETLGIRSAKKMILKCTFFSGERDCQSAGDVGLGLLIRMWSGEESGRF
jgi:hypothetical protein